MSTNVYVRDAMRREVVTLNVDDNLDLADDIMTLGRIRHLPIVRGEEVAGILSERDLFRVALSSVLQRDRAADRRWLATVPVRDAMTTPAVTIGPDADIREAVHVLAEKRIGCLPVVHNGRLVGLLSESDCLRLFEAMLSGADCPPIVVDGNVCPV